MARTLELNASLFILLSVASTTAMDELETPQRKGPRACDVCRRRKSTLFTIRAVRTRIRKLTIVVQFGVRT